MKIENIKLVVACISKDIYMAKINKDSMMDIDNRRVATEEVLRAAAEWFIANQKTSCKFNGYGTLAWIPDNRYTTEEIKTHLNKLQEDE
ncbi:DUF7446 family protein [Staphylococcus pseudintermedius]|uniref:DUF7446 family protein n=1 Tax=Staphylococcus pseudintermedius TaxID=283734 RepID=UPI000D736A4B|nr:hypothetical protein [Staphylococcus pseudintermedius]EGQ1277978.1 hypothetical protein [Staphylococcus pseudintermedius]EGQ1299571.1 hypothetical protein [Staphylococcus pseudintermedius]EGQ2747775.1 hypothetical protein [Staphylococcus pseudintermedius]EHA6097458.1 hypothetical protein [Staphylococcus pseudintermedius]EHB2547004.1 hypothetical protein [Staphylococcus pseudintermedius]